MPTSMPAILPSRMLGRMRYLLGSLTASWPPAFPRNLGTRCVEPISAPEREGSLMPNVCSHRVTAVGFDVPRFLSSTSAGHPSVSHPLVRFRLDGFPANDDKAEEAEKGYRSGP